MLGIAGLSIGALIVIFAVYYILDYYEIVKKVLPVASGIVPKNPIFLIVAILAVIVGTGVITVDTGEVIGLVPSAVPSAMVGETFQYQIPIIGMEHDGTAFTDTTYAVHLISAEGMIDGRTVDDIYLNPQAPFKPGEGSLSLLAMLAQTEYEDGLTGVPGAYAGTSTAAEFADTITSGEWAWNAVTAQIGDVFYAYGRYDTTWAAGEYEPFVKRIVITGTNPDQGEFALDNNRQRVYYIGTEAAYNFAETSVAGYTEDEDSAANDKLITIDFYNDANSNRTVDNHLYVELTVDMKTRMDTITVSNDNGEFAKYTQLADTTNLNTDDWRYESAPSLTVSTSTMYYAGPLPDSLRTATADKDKVGVEIQYDHSGATNVNKWYVYDVHFGRFGSDFHIDGDNFWVNATTGGADGWT